MKQILLCFFVLMAATAAARADTISFDATVNQSKIALNEVLELTLTVTGVKDDLEPISLPAIDGFSAKYLGPSTNVSIVNGDYHSERSFIYNLFPNKVGHFQIPSITATIAGQTYASKPIDVDVLENLPTDQSNQEQAQNQAPSVESLKDKILIMAAVGKTHAYLNERIPLSIKFLINNVPIRDIQYPQFEKNGFTVDDFSKPEQYSKVINGIKYDVVEFKTSLYPTHLGEVSVGPIQIAGNILYKNGDNNPFNQENFLGSDVFNNFFESYATRPVTVTSRIFPIHVFALPEENRPQNFSGAVGRFDFQASVSPTQVKAGDPLTLKMDLKGSGNLKGLKMPVFQGKGFKTYDLKVKDVDDGKTAEEVIIPTSAAIKEIPALHFSYFDPISGDYRRITQGPFPIHVAAPSPEQEFKAVGFVDISKERPTVMVPQFSIWKMLLSFNKGLKKVLTSFRFWLGFVLILSGGFGYILWQRFLERLEHDPAFARRLKAFKEATQGLNQARQYMGQGKTKDFYALLSKILRDYLANKWHLASASLSVEEIARRLKSANIDETRINQIKALLEQSDLVCFASTPKDAADMQKDHTLAQGLIHYLKDHLH